MKNEKYMSAFPPAGDMSHTDPLTGVGKRKRKVNADLKAQMYRKALLDLLFVQATTGQLGGGGQPAAAPQMAPQPSVAQPMDLLTKGDKMDPSMMGGAPPPGMMG